MTDCSRRRDGVRGPDEDELAAAYRDATDPAATIAREWDEASDEAWNDLVEDR